MSFFTNTTVEQVSQKGTTLATEIAVQNTNYTLCTLSKTQELIHKRLPLLVAQTELFKGSMNELDLMLKDTIEIRDQIREMDRINSFYTCIDLLRAKVSDSTRAL
jgi:hypothetical protein